MILGNQTVSVDQVMWLKARTSQIFEDGDIMVIHLKIRAGKNINLYVIRKDIFLFLVKIM